MPYSAALDGIRALAILAVLLYHAAPGMLPGGFTGVDVFFVLSGFLITSIILHDLRAGTFSLGEFYLRRMQRIWPNIILTVLAVVALWSLLGMPSTARQVGRHGIWTLANLSNFFIWKTYGDYWGGSGEAAPLLHTWSLAVEEQFYLIFPACLMWLARRQRERTAGWLLLAAASSLALCVYLTPLHATAAFYLLPTRVWELLLGAWFACRHLDADARDARSPALHEFAGWAGLALVATGYFAIQGERGFPGAVALIPTLGTLLLLYSVTCNTRVTRLLSAPALVTIGRLSYSLYLWHWPLITLGRAAARLRGLPPLAGSAVGAAAGIALAWAAYRYIEQPLRRRGPGRQRRLIAISSAFVLVLAAAGWTTRTPLPDTHRYFDTPEFHGFLYTAGKATDTRSLIGFQDVLAPHDARNNEAWRSGGIQHAWGNGAPQIVVMGSSHAMMYSRMVDEICRDLHVPVAFLTMGGVPAIFGIPVTTGKLTPTEAHEFDRVRRDRLRAWHPRALFVIDRWDLFAGAATFDGDLHRFLAEISPWARNVLFVAQPPVPDSGGDEVNLRELFAWRGRYGATTAIFPDYNEGRRRHAIAAAEKIADGLPNLKLLRPDRAFYQADGSVRIFSGRTMYYADDDHLSQAGADLVRGIFQEAIAAALR